MPVGLLRLRGFDESIYSRTCRYRHGNGHNAGTPLLRLGGGIGNLRGPGLKEVTCICGERVVFLDPEVETKTCPNCGMPVRQFGLPPIESLPTAKKTRKSRPVGRRVLFMAGVVAVFLAVVAAIFSIQMAKRSAIAQAAIAERDAEGAEARGELNTAAAAYRRAVRAYKSWSIFPEKVGPLEAALERVEKKLADAAVLAAQLSKSDELLSISLEELARQAYAGSPEAFQPIFDHDYAGRIVVLHGRVEEGSGRAYKASALTLSYRVFSPSGDHVALAFNGPFFERYRLKQGSECLVRAVLAQMYRDAGGPGETGQWVLVLDGAKSALVTDSDQLKGLGWKLDDEISNLITLQRSLSPAY